MPGEMEPAENDERADDPRRDPDDLALRRLDLDGRRDDGGLGHRGRA